MKRYRSHKVVEAAPIQNIYEMPDGRWKIGLEGGVRMGCDAKLFARGVASPGDYIVRYADGYVSWSPRQAFLDGYVEIEAPA